MSEALEEAPGGSWTWPEKPAISDPASHEAPGLLGWDCESSDSIRREFEARSDALGEHDPGPAKFSWLRPKMLWQSRNDQLEKWARSGFPGLRPVVNDVREGWVEQIVGDLDTDSLVKHFAIDRWAGEETASLLVVGDTGEGDKSQVVTTPAVTSLSAAADAMVIMSDVLYPAGSVNEYAGKVNFPYRDVAAPILALPGNHDWYDLLEGFATHFLGAEGRAPEAQMSWVQRLLWRKGEDPDADLIALADAQRGLPSPDMSQPGPYWTLDTEHVRFVAIDTGIDGSIDDAQGRWLLAVSEDSRPKVLLTGKPLVVDGRLADGSIDWTRTPKPGFKTIGDVVRHRSHRYLAAIGGDVHNYQRYLCRTDDDRWQTYIVAGGGGAFMHATHQIDEVAIGRGKDRRLRCEESDTRLYPLRGDSLSRYSYLLRGPWSRLRIDRGPAKIALSRMIGVPVTGPVDPEDEPTDADVRHTAKVRTLGGRSFARRVSEFLDWDDPPFFKHALRIEVGPGRICIRCFGITGCEEHEAQPPVEDEVLITFESDPS